MARARSQATLERLQEAALDVLARQGFAEARVGEIARRAGVAHGTVYGYADGKEALLLLALSGGALPALDRLPLPRPSAGALRRAGEARATALHACPPLDAALARSEVVDGIGELVGILADHYDTARRGAGELALLERSAEAFPSLARALADARRDLRARMQGYLESRVPLGWIEPLPDPAIAARSVLSAIGACARRNHDDPDETFRPEALARETVVSWAARGLLVPQTTEGPSGDGPVH
ncbi:MAG: helix-turn-helix transcriptional regulator [Myxococcales bacterium]|nr:helix-turn-helix transcriptional regulator [Myxococcales bacterium]